MEGLSELLAALLGALVGGGITLWEARVNRRHERMAKAVAVYTEMLDKRVHLVTMLLQAGKALAAVNAKPDTTSDQAFRSSLVEVSPACDQIQSLTWIVFASDSSTLRRGWTVAMADSLVEMRDGLHNRDLSSFEKHRSEEGKAYAGLSECVSKLNELLPKLPQPGEGSVLNRWFRPFR